jgi:cbb3-type cytochrome oxidase cytochrome c subunit
VNYGALFFLAGFIALSSSWFGLVLAPQLQVGRQELATNSVTSALYPSRRPGLAEQGAEVYRANGCVSCHSQQVRQSGTVFDVVLNEAGTNQAAVVAALSAINSKLNAASLAALPQNALTGIDKPASEAAVTALKDTGAKYEVRVRPTGADIERGWGLRGTVAQDYVQDNPVFLGSQRLGPDLANIGLRAPDANWHLNHLYAPSSVVPGSTMPPYRFLFEKRKVGRQPSPAALKLTGALAPAAGFEIVPTEKALALVAYLQSLRSDAPLFEAPFSAPTAAPASTNAPAK